MSPDGSLFPNVAEFFQYLPFTGETNSTMSNNKPAPIIVRPFPDIQTYIGVRFQHTIPINPSYIVSPNGEDTDKLLLSAKFDPSSAEKWV
ncbi:6911_t:CDS:1, partial [Acaulospora morrowiae]